jgi:uncharacterized HAD superfamily protein
MSKLRLGLDLDGVLYRWTDTARYLLQEHWAVDPGESQYFDWIKDNVPAHAWEWLWREGITEHGLFRYGSLYKGSREFLSRMTQYCDNVIITSRPASAALDTMDWLSYQRIPTSEVHIIGARQKKSTVEPKCDIYIDDATHNALDILENTEAPIIVPDRPYNQDLPSNPRVIRTKSWQQVEEALVNYYYA